MGETPSDTRDFILPSQESFGLTTKGSKAEALEMYMFCEPAASCWPSRTFSLSTLVRKIFLSLCATICSAPENHPLQEVWTEGWLWCQGTAQCPVPLAEARRPREAGAMREAWGMLFPSWLGVCTTCSCAESCWEDLLPWRSFKQPHQLHCPGCEERLRIYEHSLEPNQTYLFCAVLFVKMTSSFVLINKGILTAPWVGNATL